MERNQEQCGWISVCAH